jgi:hypothetical protein
MALPNDHPLMRLSAAQIRVMRALEGVCREYDALVENVKAAQPLPPDAEIMVYRTLLALRKRIERWLARFETLYAEADGLYHEAWAHQMRQWVDGLDEELRSLGRE